MEVPGSLKRLVRTVMRGFYSVEHVLVMDMLIRKSCLKDDDLETLLHFERKQIRSITTQLKNDKMLRLKLKMETGPDGRITRQNYYYINYRAFVNVVKYKLDHMRRKIETEERDNTSRASFVCTECRKTYTDLEANLLCDLTTGEFKCTYCTALVEEDPNVLPKADSRQLLARFNDQIEPFYVLLKEVEDIVLPSDQDYELVAPDESGDQRVRSSAGSVNYVKNEDSGEEEERGRKSRDVNFDANLTVKIESVSTNGSAEGGDTDLRRDHSRSKKGKKEQPAWLLNSTIYDSNPVSMNAPSTSSKNTLSTSKNMPSTSKNTPSASYKKEKEINSTNGSDQTVVESKITELLLTHEKRDDLSAINGILDHSSSMEISGYSNGHNDVQMDSDGEEKSRNVIGVTIGGNQLVPLDCVEEGLVQHMNKEERDRFVKLTQELYSYLYD